MVSVPKTDSPSTVHPDQSAVAGTSDTESNSGKDSEVSVCVCVRVFVQKYIHISKSISLHYQDVFYTEAEMERRRMSSASSTSFWTPTPEWVGNTFLLLPLIFDKYWIFCK